MKRTNKPESLGIQMKRKVNSVKKAKPKYDGDFGTVISTGSTLLDLVISGGRVRGGGLPGGILIEAFGPSSSGKTVFLSEVAGSVQRQGGQIMFHDPEARLNKQFAKLFDLDTDEMEYGTPNTVPEVFQAVRKWEPKSNDPYHKNVIHGVFADSLAALSTDMEMDKEEGDKMGMRRAKEFSEELRKTCRIITEKNYLMVCSNQVRINMEAGPYGQKYTTPGGEAIGFYSSLRLRFSRPEKIKEKRRIGRKEVTRVKGVKVNIEVFKSSIWKPFGIAPVTILFDYGVDDVRENLQFIKDHTRMTVYGIEGASLGKSMEEAIQNIENDQLEQALKDEVINLWEEIESKFVSKRKKKR